MSAPSFLKQYSLVSKILFIGAFVLIVYGTVCRILPVYFFWESISIGWGLLFVALIFILANRIKAKRAAQRKIVPEAIGIGIIAFILLIKIIIIIVMPQTDAYAAAKQYLITNENVVNEVGTISGFRLKTSGSISVSSSASGSVGDAEIHITVEGSKKFKDYSLHLQKELQATWQVKEVF